jgi:GT2 family glycosyltransferase
VEQNIDYVFVINPDVYFIKDVISPITDFMNQNLDIGMLMPEVLNPDGTVQHLPKLLPSPTLVLLRKLKFLHSFYGEYVTEYELRSAPNQTIYETPNVSGCFTVIRTKILSDIGYYDTRFFLYFEDWDLSRRAFDKFRTVFYPFVSIYHSGSKTRSISPKKWLNRIVSYIKYFDKWGWSVNEEHTRVNSKIISSIKTNEITPRRPSSYWKKKITLKEIVLRRGYFTRIKGL